MLHFRVKDRQSFSRGVVLIERSGEAEKRWLKWKQRLGRFWWKDTHTNMSKQGIQVRGATFACVKPYTMFYILNESGCMFYPLKKCCFS